MSLPGAISASASRLAEQLLAHHASVTTVESCTGGLVAAALTAIPGSSAYFSGGLVTYSNRLKHEAVGVSSPTLEQFGAVSSQTAIEMAHGGRAFAHADYAIAITGIAGPDGGSDDKPVGTVWICIEGPGEKLDCRRFIFPGERQQVREHACVNALGMMSQRISQSYETLPHELERFQA